MNLTVNITAKEVNIHTSEIGTQPETGIDLDELLSVVNEDKETESYLDDLFDGVEAGELTADEEMLLAGFGSDELDVGDVVKLKLFGEPTEFRVVHKNYKTDGKVVLMPENIEFFHVFNRDYANVYETSEIRDYLNRVFLSGFHPLIQDAIVKTPVECSVDDEIRVVHDKLWLPSYTEIGFSGSDYAPKEGKPFEYFDNKEKRRKVGSAWEKFWWLRTPSSDSTYSAWNVSTDGTATNYTTTYDYGVVPAFEI